MSAVLPASGIALQPGVYGRASLQLSEVSTAKRAGHVVFPWSRNDSGWGALRVPIGIVSNGDGPTVLLTGANHGDEIEGSIVLTDWFNTVDATRLQGTVIVMPMLNYPAFLAGARVSPIDGGNMNRAFLQRPEGTLTEQIAYFVESELVERADAVLDIHAGGRTMMFHPFAVSHKLPDAAATQRACEALLAFGAPVGLVLEELDNRGMLDSAVESRGKLFLSTELGGGGSTSPHTVAIARRGVHNFLVHTGLLQDAPIAAPQSTRLMTNDASCYLACERDGLIEYLVELGDEVRQGQPLARVHDTARLGAAATEIAAPATGMLVGRLHGGLVKAGDFLALVAKDFSLSDLPGA